MTSTYPEVVRFTSELIRIDTRNPGDGSCDERAAVQWVRDRLLEVGIESRIFESAPKRLNLIATIVGKHPELPSLLIHGHVDTVPTANDEWDDDPLSGKIAFDGITECVWGRGAVDMKDMLAMTIAAVRAMIRSGEQPHRTVVLAVFCDEESGGAYGSEWMANNHPEVFDNVGFVISEIGGFSSQIGSRRTYYVQMGEKGTQWFSATSKGSASHGSQVNHDNAVVKAATLVNNIAAYQWPVDLNPITSSLLNGIWHIASEQQLLPQRDVQSEEDWSEDLIESVVSLTGPARPWIEACVSNTCNPTSVDVGSTVNVVPSTATTLLDGRSLPGKEQELKSTLEHIAGTAADIHDIHSSNGYLTPIDSTLYQALCGILQHADPEAAVLPFLASGGTDSKAVLMLNPNIDVCGFIPLKIPDGFDYVANFHGVDERIPVSSIIFGEGVLRTLIEEF
ncbi:M20/M25/M40 family metallo-hydrolase [Bifidobacterium sp.]|jgi:acetylornithine deacetylase/succinyl-diaminopimelate desuccinylase-like protein|uniref:M20/M25/M40 family metallo-hydrolase n=1 Tax=Bifidobacterium sp. TaxID=41200 RepID=UPI0025C46199|nr:M20/M25/M40 family metallo-hydrolase [Bifidobacterium sp.]MCI1636218.1 M20/M25/M40 family metallo-hydrolase [Bifidobacterium sp.]